jgi:hypothetical protein
MLICVGVYKLNLAKADAAFQKRLRLARLEGLPTTGLEFSKRLSTADELKYG